MSVLINGERRLVTPIAPVIFQISHSFHIFKFSFELSVMMTETSDNRFDIQVYCNDKQIFDHKFDLDIKYTFPIPELPASLLIELNEGSIVNGHATVHLKLSGIINVILTKSFQILDQGISTVFMSASDVAQIRHANGEGLTLTDVITEKDSFYLINLPSILAFSTVMSGIDQAGSYSIR